MHHRTSIKAPNDRRAPSIPPDPPPGSSVGGPLSPEPPGHHLRGAAPAPHGCPPARPSTPNTKWTKPTQPRGPVRPPSYSPGRGGGRLG